MYFSTSRYFSLPLYTGEIPLSSAFLKFSVHFCCSIYFSTSRYFSLPLYTGDIPLSSVFLKFLLGTASSQFFLHSSAALRNDEASCFCCRNAGRTEAKRNHTNGCRHHAVPLCAHQAVRSLSWHTHTDPLPTALYSDCLHGVASSNRSLSRFLTARLRIQSI